MQLKNEYMGELIHKWKESDFGEYVVTGMIDGDNSPLSRLGKLVQIRLEDGDWGSDCVLVRQADCILRPHVNQSFFRIPKKYYPEIEEFFKDVLVGDFHDRIDIEYTLSGEFPETGFIIPSKVKDGESTPMRDIKGKLYNLIEKDIKDL